MACSGYLANKGCVLAFFAHARCEVVHDGCTIGSVVKRFDVSVGVLLCRSFVSNDDNACVTSLLEDTLERLGRVRDNGDCADALSNKVLNDTNLLLGACVIGTGLGCVNAGFLGEGNNAFFHPVKPAHTSELDYVHETQVTRCSALRGCTTGAP